MRTAIWIIGLVLLFVGSIFLQVYLSKKEGKWLGRILPIISFIFSILGVLNIMGTDSVLTAVFLVFITMACANIPTIIYIMIYFHFLEKKKDKTQIDKMNIHDL